MGMYVQAITTCMQSNDSIITCTYTCKAVVKFQKAAITLTYLFFKQVTQQVGGKKYLKSS